MYEDTMALGEETLAHYGVMGMKWGRHRAQANGVDIRAARGRVATQRKKLDSAHSKAQNTADKGKREAALKEVGKMKADFLKNPDRVIASRMTRGEKQLSIGLGILTGVGIVPAVAVIAGTSAASRRIERKQEKGKYNN